MSFSYLPESFIFYACNRGSWDYNNNHGNRYYLCNLKNSESSETVDCKAHNPFALAENLKQKRISQGLKGGKKEHKTHDRQRKEGYR